ncbi:cysteine desulfurase family protein [Gymnodinialimonas ceratoperidinii]|uniref:Cysteine desulfurase n=1 Tax=Gymnodinialimonas ceratoperidinii TaxID=2856823 RepID=A0A8F6TT08_9RHOB|nr:aminotransferase class V-fold PLP-dependent enzyme [Gymnodinialimonas ceratoperidinii]QXT38412.1 aminotransferase class V-fold PLP-dependent enzyme [Gymnodinialimonas ceratoperidinii]
MRARSYLDWNATAPLRPEARAAMGDAMDLVGNPSSVHSEGRAAKAMLERARAQVAEALGAQAADIVFVSGATEAAALAMAGRGLAISAVEHDAVRAWGEEALPVDERGRVRVADPARSCLQIANSETGILQELPEGLAVSDWTQGFGKVPLAFDWAGIDMAFVSSHKIGGPKGVGALVIRRGLDLQAQIRGGGQEMGRRHGTENLIGIAGFGAAAEAAAKDLADGLWEPVDKLRIFLEKTLEDGARSTILVGKGVNRLPNTSMFITEGWKGETQVMSMDLAGFAVSAGSACSSGKVKMSGVLRAMGYSEAQAGSALRVSLGPSVSKEQVAAFCDAWLTARDRKFAR